jgi:RNA polymerase sigma-70 factor (ECF subfamily)
MPAPNADTFAEDLIALLPNLRRFALSLARASDVADDLVQVTVERALLARDRYDPAARLDAWCFRILKNAWIDMTRRSRIRGVTVDVHETPEAAVTEGTETLDRLMLDQVLTAMAGLSEDHREVLTLVCLEDMSYAEAAEVIGVPKGTVMSRLARARAALAERLGM